MKVVAAVRLEIFRGVSLAHGACLCGGLIKNKNKNGQNNSAYFWFALSMVRIWINAKLFLTSLPGS